MAFTFSLLDAQQEWDTENFDYCFLERSIPPSICGRPVVRSSSLFVVVAQSRLSNKLLAEQNLTYSAYEERIASLVTPLLFSQFLQTKRKNWYLVAQ